MDWMYKGLAGNVDREEYLTGRKIDKTFELIEKEENPNSAKDEEESALINQLAQKNLVDVITKNDLDAKMREDPLFAIQMKQREQRKEILHNPVKLKHLQTLLKTSLKKDKKHKKGKKDKKEKKSKHKTKRSEAPYSKSNQSSSQSSSQNDESDSERYRRRHHKLERRRKKDEQNHNHEFNKRQSDRKPHKSSREREIETQKRKNSFSTTSNYRSSSADRSSDRHKSIDGKDQKSQPIASRHQKRSRLTEEELNKRREEMMSNAKWREQQRAETVKKLNEKDKEEESRLFRGAASSGAKFIKPMLSDMANSRSIEDSIRQKKFTSQRDPGAMGTNFARLQ